MAGLVHLAKRFFGASRPGAPSFEDEQWAREHLLSAERDIWDRMNNPDRRHAVTVARSVVETLVPIDAEQSQDRAVIAAALLHDSGKVICGFRTPARVAATVLWGVLDDGTADRWLADTSGVRRRFAQYRRHPELGAELLRAAGSDPLTADWAAQHHQPEDRWSVPVDVGRVLKDCDDD